MRELILLIILLIYLVFFSLLSYFVLWKLLIKPTYLSLSGAHYYFTKLSKKKKKTKQEIKEAFLAIIEEARYFCAKDGVPIRLLPFYTVSSRNALGFGIYAKINTILFSAVWIELILTKSPKWKISFAQSVGHELAHKDDIFKGLFFFLRKRTDRKFFNWVREIRNDICGVEFAIKHYGYTKEEVYEAVRMKANLYNATTLQDTDHMSHPSWQFRQIMMKRWSVLTEEAVREIAERAGCKNEQYIEKIANTVAKNSKCLKPST